MTKKTEKIMARIAWKTIEIVAFIATMAPFVVIELAVLKGFASRGIEFNTFLMYAIIIGIVLTLAAGLAYGLVMWIIGNCIQKIK